jgi:hypothetical protein
MKQHTKIAYNSRGYSLDDTPVPCEYSDCWSPAVDCHHIWNSNRGKRDNDPYNLCLLCRFHHDLVHKEHKESTMNILRMEVKWILDNIEERKQQARLFNYYL